MASSFEIIIHPGMSKTATTFLQKFCFSNLDDVHNIFKPNFVNDQRLVDIRESLMNKEGHDYKLIKMCIRMVFEKRSEASAEEIIREAKELYDELMSL